jgi:hypothetical protein
LVSFAVLISSVPRQAASAPLRRRGREDDNEASGRRWPQVRFLVLFERSAVRRGVLY